ncbi:3-deoxy-D-manno-octulosonate 8-phosphate phosphatase KdsC [Candidatus Erwinia haradaeae]|uniref:3-deoxy-D-manno-octulosonate 8-phosphate phosphatase KdsC n=1 Tax=Candidatus Erwinia haradaeae TaxID=1922217 RepID=A0A451DLR9_9GAMM|nr:3-deoxy-manno-octulosonate-8-phosphatase KdsC [Candidatus Erwinia haradaeae]VFP87694.1 3-deoxy-D-manno-octulosonate 8-phosphate phosphatase KdsC [Candidatus Erwinia haradaeae]
MNDTHSFISTVYGPVALPVIQKAKQVKLLICDVDGVMSNGIIYQGDNGEKFQSFHIRDGYGIHCLLTAKIEVAVITGRQSKALEERCATLGIKHLYQGKSDKTRPFHLILEKLKLSAHEVAYIGDDLADLPVMLQVGLNIAVSDAHPILLAKAHYITQIAGGCGAVREICDLILISQGKMTIDCTSSRDE